MRKHVLQTKKRRFLFTMYCQSAAFSTVWKYSRLIEVGRLIEVQYKLGRNGSQRNFIASI